MFDQGFQVKYRYQKETQIQKNSQMHSSSILFGLQPLLIHLDQENNSRTSNKKDLSAPETRRNGHVCKKYWALFEIRLTDDPTRPLLKNRLVFWIARQGVYLLIRWRLLSFRSCVCFPFEHRRSRSGKKNNTHRWTADIHSLRAVVRLRHVKFCSVRPGLFSRPQHGPKSHKQ